MGHGTGPVSGVMRSPLDTWSCSMVADSLLAGWIPDFDLVIHPDDIAFKVDTYKSEAYTRNLGRGSDRPISDSRCPGAGSLCFHSLSALVEAQ